MARGGIHSSRLELATRWLAPLGWLLLTAGVNLQYAGVHLFLMAIPHSRLDFAIYWLAPFDADSQQQAWFCRYTVLRHFDLNGHAVSVDLLHGVPPHQTPFSAFAGWTAFSLKPRARPLHVLRWEGLSGGTLRGRIVDFNMNPIRLLKSLRKKRCGLCRAHR